MLLTVMLLTLFGCSDPQAGKNEALRKEIIDVHDLAMDKIGYMFALEIKLKKREPQSEAARESISQRVKALQGANRAMFSWMNQYQTLAVDDDISRDNQYRLEQLDMIKEVSRLTDQAILEAEQILSGD